MAGQMMRGPAGAIIICIIIAYYINIILLLIIVIIIIIITHAAYAICIILTLALGDAGPCWRIPVRPWSALGARSWNKRTFNFIFWSGIYYYIMCIYIYIYIYIYI